MESRLKLLREEMKAQGEGAYLVTEGKNRLYLSGFRGSAGWLVVGPERLVLIVDGRYWGQIEALGAQIELFRYVPSTHGSLAQALVQALRVFNLKANAIAVEIDDMPVATYRDIATELSKSSFKVKEVEGRVKRYRAIKDAGEVALLRQAALIADQAFRAALERFEPGTSEAALRAELDYEAQKRGGEGTSFPTIVASGRNGSFPHAGASDKLIVEDELITIDFGVVWKGYCSDMTRTVWYGQLGQKEQNLLGSVARAQQLAVAAAKPGIEAGALDEVARSYLRQVGLGEFFSHSLGHGVGLDVHERPMIRAARKDILEAGQVITIEPGVYIPEQTGCRIEDTLVLTKNGCEVINSTPKQQLGQTKPIF